MAHLLVGCGGSGIETLIRLNELLAQDEAWRYKVDQEIFCVAVDTEEAKLRRFEDRIQRLFRTITPTIRTIHLSQNVPSLEQLVKPYFIEPFGGPEPRDVAAREKRQKAHDALYAHWWSRKTSEGKEFPFLAPEVVPLTDGAGQCPPASYFLAWYCMKQIETTFNAVFTNVINYAPKAGAGAAPLTQLNVLIVAGLAGGTGRGCWELIAFKLREMLCGWKAPPKPVAVLFDASVFENIALANPSLRVPMAVNSLTGFSELQAWMANRKEAVRGEKPVFYRLPLMTDPGNASKDVLKVDLELTANDQSPVHDALMIFKSSLWGSLNTNDQCYEMAGTALYGLATEPSVRAGGINKSFPYSGLAAAAYEIKVHALRTYYESRLRLKTAEALVLKPQPLPPPPPRSAGKKTTEPVLTPAQELEKHVQEKVAAFLKEHPIHSLVTGNDEGNQRQLAPDARGNLLQRACYQLDESYQQDKAALDAKLKESDVDGSVEQAKQFGLEREDRVEPALTKAVEDAGDPGVAACDQARAIFAEKLSISASREFLERVRGQWVKDKAALPQRVGAAAAAASDEQSGQPVGAEGRVVALKGRTYWVFGERFPEGDCKEILEHCSKHLLRANYAKLADGLRSRIDGWVEEVNGLLDGIHLVEEAASKMRGVLESNMTDEMAQLFNKETAANSDLLFDALFTNRAEPERGLPELNAVEAFYQRTLKPVFDCGRQDDILALASLGREVIAAVAEALEGRIAGRNPDEKKDILARKLEDGVRKTVFLPDNFISTNFQLPKVIGDLRDAWTDRFKELKGRKELRDACRKRFEFFFGEVCDESGGEIMLLDLDKFVYEMMFSLASRCRPYWILSAPPQPNEPEALRVTIFLPKTFDRQAATQYLSSRQKGTQAYITIPGTGKEGECQNPYVVLAYAREGSYELDNIKSLDYWNQDEVLDWLRKCESREGQAVFDSGSGNKGMGYGDPMYVRNEKTARARWREWAKYDDAGAERSVDSEAIEALHYALIRPGGGLGRALEKARWRLPLLTDQDEPDERFYFTRLAYTDEERHAYMGSDGWLEEQTVNHIRHLYDFLREAGETPEQGRRFRQIILQESSLFWEKVLPKVGFKRSSKELDYVLRDYGARLTDWHKNETLEQEVADPENRDAQVYGMLLEYHQLVTTRFMAGRKTVAVLEKTPRKKKEKETENSTQAGNATEGQA